MRILFVSTLFPSSREPTRAMYNRQHFGALRQLGHEIEVIAPVITVPGLPQLLPGRFPPREERIDGIRVWHPPFYRTPGTLISCHDTFLRASVGRCFRRVVDDFQPDHVLLGFLFPEAAAFQPLCEKLGLAWSVMVFGSDYLVRRHQRRIAPKLRRVLRAAPLVHCPGQRLKQHLVAGGVAAEKVIAFENGIDPARFHPSSGAGNRERVALYIGHLRSVKGADRLVHAWRHATADPACPADAQLHIIGHGELAPQLRADARHLPNPDRVRFLGALPHDEVAEHLRRAHCLILPSRSEGMPNVVVEALACGTPVVATDVGEVPFLVSHDANGYVVPAASNTVSEELGTALARTLGRQWDAQAIAEPLRGQTWEAAARTLADAIAESPRPGGG